jgi:hypothetical protein
MSNKETVQLNGAAQLIAVLRELPQVTEEKVMRKGLVAAGGRLRTYMRRAAARITGLLAKSIRVKRYRTPKGQTIVKVGLRRNYFYKVLDAGRKAFTRKDGTEVSASPEMKSQGTGIERTWESRKKEIADMVITEATKEFAREAGRLAAKSGYRPKGGA